MVEGIHEKPQFKTPEEELEFLRREVARRELELEAASGDAREVAIKKSIEVYKQQKPDASLSPKYKLKEEEAETIALDLAPEEHDVKMNELLGFLREKGVRNTLSLVEKMENPHIEDDFHRVLVQYVKENLPAPGLKERGPLWRALHMTLYEIALPEARKEDIGEKTLKELLSSMEQFYAGMLSVSAPGGRGSHFTLELAVSDGSDEIILYAAIPDAKKDLFEKQLLSLFPTAQINEQKNDYNIFVSGGAAVGSRGALARNPIFPLKTYDQFDYDPLNVILNTFSKIEKEGGGAALQIVFNPAGDFFVEKYKEALKQLHKGVSAKKALDVRYTIGGEFWKSFKEVFEPGKTSKEKEEAMTRQPDQVLIENIQNKVATPIVRANIGLIASAKTESRAQEILDDLESAFNQFENTQGNRLKFKRLVGRKRKTFFKEFSFRDFSQKHALPLGLRELATLIHLPAAGIKSSPQFRQAKAGSAAAPINLPSEGTLLGVNKFRNVETEARLTKEDRLRHFYVVGQTGTGKTTLLKNMIAQDITDGEGVCMIDPHGTDIVDVLALIPKERFDDVIYFDPGHTKRVMALNMLEYDPAYPEQKTFVVNELFSIFQKLYGAVPESMGPMFEQYFRNATMLVLEDPQSGNTLLDVSRVLSDARFRELKLSRCRNPVITQFWREIATKAGGEQSLANIVPYITSKFDVFMANEIMRPVIAQEKSTFNFRRIMDERKILLVNLAKGRLGDINSNLIGLIIVGKILMAALSRVDSVGERPPFYLYIDEFQNVTTDSIATILSEARKYRLSLTIAHQFIAQLEENIKDAVFGNVGSMAAFRVGPEDAEFLEKQFEPVFNENDLMNIDNRNAYVRLLADGRPAKPFNVEILPPQKGDLGKVEQLKELSYQKYGRERDDVEHAIREKYQGLTQNE